MADSFESDREAQLRDKAYRIAGMTPAEEGYDPARSARARELLGALAKHAPIEVAPPQNHQPRDVQDDVELQRNQTPGELALHENLHPMDALGGGIRSIDARLPRMPAKVEEYLVRPLAAAGAAHTMGASQAASDLAGTDNPQDRGAWEAKHPGINAAARTAGALIPSPVNLLSKAAGATSSALESALGPLIKNSPRVAALLGYGGAALPAGGKILGGAARGALEGGALAAEQGAVEGIPEGPGGVVRGAASQAPGGAASGAVFGGVQPVAAAGAKALRTPGIALAEKYGMEPSLVKPLASQDKTLLGQFREPPPTGVSTAGPKSRQASALRAAKEIVPDINAREAASSRHLGAERQGNKVDGIAGAEIRKSDPVDILQAIAQKPGVSDATRAKLRQVQERIEEFSAPAGGYEPTANTRQDASGPPTVRPGRTDVGTAPTINEATPQPSKRTGSDVIKAEDLQQIAGGLAYKLAKPDAPGGPKDRQVLRAGKQIKELLPGEMQEQDARYSASRKDLFNAKKALGIDRKSLKGQEGQIPQTAIEGAANTISRAAEDTKAGGNAEERLRQLEPPEIMKDRHGKPSGLIDELKPVNYRGLTDNAALQSVQENLQLPGSMVFSGGRTSGTSHLVGTPARRVLYPELKRISNAEIGPTAVVGGDIVRAVKAGNEERKKKTARNTAATAERGRLMEEHAAESKRRRDAQFQQDQE